MKDSLAASSNRRRHSFAAIFAMLSLTLLVTMFRVENLPVRILLLWSSLSTSRLSAAYLRRNARVFGKRADGSMAPAAVLVMLPFLLLTWCVWLLQITLFRVPVCSAIAPMFFLGRRCRRSALPASAVAIVDVTAEFPTPVRLRREYRIIVVPVLDGCAPTWEECMQVFERLRELGNPVAYVHCANGHGRSATVMAVLLGLFGTVNSAEEALKFIKSARPAIGPNGDQRAFLEAAFQKLSGTPGVAFNASAPTAEEA